MGTQGNCSNIQNSGISSHLGANMTYMEFRKLGQPRNLWQPWKLREIKRNVRDWYHVPYNNSHANHFAYDRGDEYVRKYNQMPIIIGCRNQSVCGDSGIDIACADISEGTLVIVDVTPGSLKHSELKRDSGKEQIEYDPISDVAFSNCGAGHLGSQGFSKQKFSGNRVSKFAGGLQGGVV
jgi:hypothetical protein